MKLLANIFIFYIYQTKLLKLLLVFLFTLTLLKNKAVNVFILIQLVIFTAL